MTTVRPNFFNFRGRFYARNLACSAHKHKAIELLNLVVCQQFGIWLCISIGVLLMGSHYEVK